VKHISTAVWAPPGFLQWHEVALQLPKCTQCTAQHQQQAQQCVQGTYCGGWRRCACLDAKTRVLAVGGLVSVVSTTYNNLTADLLPTREVPCAWPAPALAGWCCYLGVLPPAAAVVAVVVAVAAGRWPGGQWPRWGRGRGRCSMQLAGRGRGPWAEGEGEGGGGAARGAREPGEPGGRGQQVMGGLVVAG
jgi:hypothetical protein